MSATGASPLQRLFIALWPPARVTRQLSPIVDGLRIECGGRKIIVNNQHVTLLFLGNVRAELLPWVGSAMRSAAAEAFVLELDRLEYRKRGGVLWARATRVPAALNALVMRLRFALRESGILVDERRFVPHMTLLRDARRPLHVPVITPARWLAVEITLVRSRMDRSGAHYEIVARAPLAPLRSAQRQFHPRA